MSKIKFPCLDAKLVSVEKVKANDYNPNKVANPEMELLKHSIEEDGVTQPIVVYHDKTEDEYEVVDGFHRYIILKDQLNCYEIPVTVINKAIEERMASTIRHNRARGEHQVDLQAELVKELLEKGWKDNEIAKHLGMEFEEVLRLKQVTGIASIVKYEEYGRAWEAEDNE